MAGKVSTESAKFVSVSYKNFRNSEVEKEEMDPLSPVKEGSDSDSDEEIPSAIGDKAAKGKREAALSGGLAKLLLGNAPKDASEEKDNDSPPQSPKRLQPSRVSLAPRNPSAFSTNVKSPDASSSQHLSRSFSASPNSKSGPQLQSLSATIFKAPRLKQVVSISQLSEPDSQMTIAMEDEVYLNAPSQTSISSFSSKAPSSFSPGTAIPAVSRSETQTPMPLNSQPSKVAIKSQPNQPPGTLNAASHSKSSSRPHSSSDKSAIPTQLQPPSQSGANAQKMIISSREERLSAPLTSQTSSGVHSSRSHKNSPSDAHSHHPKRKKERILTSSNSTRQFIRSSESRFNEPPMPFLKVVPVIGNGAAPISQKPQIQPVSASSQRPSAQPTPSPEGPLSHQTPQQLSFSMPSIGMGGAGNSQQSNVSGPFFSLAAANSQSDKDEEMPQVENSLERETVTPTLQQTSMMQNSRGLSRVAQKLFEKRRDRRGNPIAANSFGKIKQMRWDRKEKTAEANPSGFFS